MLLNLCWKQSNIGPFCFFYSQPPILWGKCVGTFDLLIYSEGDVCRHFDLLFLGSQKFTFLRGRNTKSFNKGMQIKNGMAHIA